MSTDPETTTAPMTMVGGRNGDVPGSVLTTCDDCRCDVWFTPESVRLMTIRIRGNLQTKVACIPCMMKDVEKEMACH